MANQKNTISPSLEPDGIDVLFAKKTLPQMLLQKLADLVYMIRA